MRKFFGIVSAVSALFLVGCAGDVDESSELADDGVSEAAVIAADVDSNLETEALASSGDNNPTASNFYFTGNPYNVTSTAGKARYVTKWVVTPYINTSANNASRGLLVKAYNGYKFIAEMTVSASPTGTFDNGHGYMIIYSADRSRKETFAWKLDNNNKITASKSMTPGTSLTLVAQAFLSDSHYEGHRRLGKLDCLGAVLSFGGGMVAEGAGCLSAPMVGVTAIACAGGATALLGAGISVYTQCF